MTYYIKFQTLVGVYVHPLLSLSPEKYIIFNHPLPFVFRLFGNVGSCSGCGQQIPANEMVMRAGVSSAPSPVHPGLHHPVFHLHCFTCSKCGNRLNTGERYYILGNSLYCEMDYNKMLKQPNSMPGQPAGGTTVRKGKVGRPRRSRD